MKPVSLIPSVVCLSFTASMLSGQTYSNAAILTAQTPNTAYVLSEQHTVVKIDHEYTSFETQDANNPLNGSSGNCFGAVEIIEGIASGNGYCVLNDPGGDQFSLVWKTTAMGKAGNPSGTWYFTGGTGKYDGAMGDGSFAVQPDEDPTTLTNILTGEIILR